MKSLHSRAALLALALVAALAACKRADNAAQMPTVTEAAAEATAPAAVNAPTAALANAAEAINPLSAKDEISRMMDNFVTVKSYHVDMDTSSPKGDMKMDMDFVAPDRY